ncbi:MAG TPA: hypothetical protein IAC67_02805 [Candidatus Coproplasma excrementipullorum]|nr:hypothetical protein [Candidatus Coproplasma excrementipullorum]
MYGPHENWFLVDPKDKDKYTALTNKLGGNMVISFMIAIISEFAVAMIAAEALADYGVWLYMAIAAAWFVYYVVLIVRNNVQRKALLAANEAKFTDCELDEIRRGLQREYYLSQRRTSIVMLCIIAVCTLAGLILAVCWTDYSQPGWGATIGIAAGTCFIFSLIPALISAFVMAIFYGRKVKPDEQRVSDLLTAQYEEAYYREHPEERE